MPDQQPIMKLMQQISIYQELLAQLTYQNQLLGRNMGINNTNPNSQMSMNNPQMNNPQMTNQMGQNPMTSHLNYPPELLNSMLSSMGGSLAMNGLNNLPNLNNPSGLSNLLGLNPNSIGNLTALSSMMPNMSNYGSFQNPMMNGGNLQNMRNLPQGMQMPGNLPMNDILRIQI